MRHLLLTASLTLLTFAPLRAFAQTDDEETQGDEETSGPEGSSTIAPEKRAKPSSTGKASSPGTQHTVEKGDTLWDLSQKFLGSPWYWPKVWSYNPEIANPHWIYPGNQVRFIPTGEEVPTQVEVGNGPEDDVEQPQLVDDSDRVQVSGKIGYVPKGGTVRLEGFVTSKEVEEAGVISGSFSEAQMLSFPDKFYVTYSKGGAVKMGESYVVYRTAKQISHPVTG